MVRKAFELNSSTNSNNHNNTIITNERSQQIGEQEQSKADQVRIQRNQLTAAVEELTNQQNEQQQREQQQQQQQQQQHIDIDLDAKVDEIAVSSNSKFNYARHAQSLYNLRPLAETTNYQHQYNLLHNHHTHSHPHLHHSEQEQLQVQNNNLSVQNAHVDSMHYTLSSAAEQTPMPCANVGAIMPTEIPREDEERLERIFRQLDRNGDGKIDIHDLSAALHEFGMSSVYAEKFLQQSDMNQSGNVGFAEFLHYVREHEKNLILQFSHLDKNRDGRVDLEELISAFNDLGLDVDVEEARNLLSRMDKDGSLNISFSEWRDFMLLAASSDIHDLIKFWRHSTLRFKHDGDNSVIASKVQIQDDDPSKSNLSKLPQESRTRNLSSGFLKFLITQYFLSAITAKNKMKNIKSEQEKVQPLAKNGKKKLDWKMKSRIYKEYEKEDDWWWWHTSKLKAGKVLNLFQALTILYNLPNYWRIQYIDIGEDMNVPDDFTQKEMQTGLWWRHLVAGGFAGAVSRTCTAPLDRIKVYLQVQTHKMGISDCVRLMLNEGGTRSLWRGNGMNVVKIAPETAFKFAAYEHIKRLIRGGDDTTTSRHLTISERFYAGAAAGGISQTVIYPMEVLKTRLALRKTGQYKGIFDAAAKIFRTEGVGSFYRGYVPNILGILPYAGIDLAVYETLKRRYIETHSQNEQPSFVVLLACGSISSALGQLCSYPLALVRTRLQAQAAVKAERRRTIIPLMAAEDTAISSQATMTGQFRKIIHNEGLTGLYRGITPNFLKVLPAVSISYVVYEYSSRALGIKMS